MKKGISIWSFPKNTLENNFQLAKKAGFEGVEVALDEVGEITTQSTEKELLAVVKEVMSREELKYCPHGRPICVTLSKKQLEKQFKRS